MTTWNVNVVRIPLNEDCWLSVNGINQQYAGQNYISAIVDYVELLHQYGMYAELSLMWGAPGSYQATYQPAAPDEDHSPAMWSSMAATFKNDPNMNLAPWGETTVGWKCFMKKGCDNEATYGPSNAYYQTAAMRQAVTLMRHAGYNGVISIPCIDYANACGKIDGSKYGGSTWLESRPHDPANQLIAEAHVYGKNACDTTACFNSSMRPITKVAPMIFGETGETYGGSDCGRTYVPTFMNWADQYGVGYEAWTWDTWGGCGVLISIRAGTPPTRGRAGSSATTSAYNGVTESRSTPNGRCDSSRSSASSTSSPISPTKAGAALGACFSRISARAAPSSARSRAAANLPAMRFARSPASLPIAPASIGSTSGLATRSTCSACPRSRSRGVGRPRPTHDRRTHRSRHPKAGDGRDALTRRTFAWKRTCLRHQRVARSDGRHRRPAGRRVGDRTRRLHVWLRHTHRARALDADDARFCGDGGARYHAARRRAARTAGARLAGISPLCDRRRARRRRLRRFRVDCFRFERDHVVSTPAISVWFAVAMAVAAVAAPILGKLFDRFGGAIVAIALAVGAAATPMAFLGSGAVAQAGVALWGVGIAVQDALLLALVAACWPPSPRSRVLRLLI